MSYDLKAAVGWITVIFVAVSIATYILSLLIDALVITTTQLGSQLQTVSAPLLVWAFLLGFETPPASAALIVAASLIVFAVCFIKAATGNGGLLSGLRIFSRGSTPRSLPNWLAIMPLVGSGLLVIVVSLSLLQYLFGVSTGSLGTTNSVVLFPSLALAPIAEEIGFRATPIGLATAIVVAAGLGRHRARGGVSRTATELAMFFSAFVSPGFAKEQAGLPSVRTGGLKGIHPAEWVLLVITSLVFGVYHIIGQSGWGPGKFLTAGLSGFGLGLVYIAYGAYASVLLHWFFDLYLYAYSVYNIAGGVFVVFGDIVALGALALGVWSIIIGVYWAVTRRSPTMIP